jgi:preprotein translocase subunit SecG
MCRLTIASCMNSLNNARAVVCAGDQDKPLLTIHFSNRYNLPANFKEAFRMTRFLDISLIITSVGLILSVILQSKGAGLGGLTGADTGGVFTARRGIERVLFWITIGLSVIFFGLVLTTIILGRLGG